MLQTDFARELPDAIHQVLPLTMDDLCDVIKLTLGHHVASLHALHLTIDLLELLLVRGEVVSQLQLHILLSLQVLLHSELLTATLFELSLCLEQLLLLLHGLLHFLVAAQELLFIVVDLLEEFLLLAFLLLLSLLLSFEL